MSKTPRDRAEDLISAMVSGTQAQPNALQVLREALAAYDNAENPSIEWIERDHKLAKAIIEAARALVGEKDGD